MSLAKDLKVKVSVDGLCLTSTHRVNDINIGNKLGDYVAKAPPHRIGKDKAKQRDEDILDAEKPQKFERCHHYNWRRILENKHNGNLLKVCNMRISKEHLIPAIYLQFFSSIDSPLSRRDVEKVLEDLEKSRSLNFRIAGLHLAIDIIHPTKTGLHKRVNRAINFKKKRTFSEIGSTTTGGSPKSSNRVSSYNKTEQLLEKKGISKKEAISRIEIRMHPHRMGNFISMLDDLEKRRWALPLYGRYFSLDSPNLALKALLGKGVMKIAIRNLKGELIKHLGEPLPNFHRDYLQEHKLFGPMVRKALARFRWK
jgi:hypothetical protein